MAAIAGWGSGPRAVRREPATPGVSRPGNFRRGVNLSGPGTQRGIYPPLLADQGLVPALQAQARKVSLPVEIDADGIGRYPQDTEAAVYFCTLEALQNITKYASASRAKVGLSCSDDSLRFTVTDDGTGFDTATTRYGTGLQGMADRLAALGGALRVRSQPGDGTILSGELPLTPCVRRR